MRAVARYDWGRWLADCPNTLCANALALTIGQEQWLCRWYDNRGVPDGCGTTAPIDWPDNPMEIMAALATKPESQRHWQPEEAEAAQP